jgi:hypothetical protein
VGTQTTPQPKADKSVMTVPQTLDKSVQKQQQQANRETLKNILERDATLFGNTVKAILEYAAHILNARAELKPLGGSYWNDFQERCRGGQSSVSKLIQIAENAAYKDPKLIKCLPNNVEALYTLCHAQPKALLAMPTSASLVPKTEFTAKPVINPGLSLNQARALVGKTPPPSHTKTPKPPAPKPRETKPPDATAKHEGTAPDFLDLSLIGGRYEDIKQRMIGMFQQLAVEFPELSDHYWEVAGEPRPPQPKATQPKSYTKGMKVPVGRAT